MVARIAMYSLACSFAAAITFTGAACTVGASPHVKTRIVRWSPFTASGRLKPSLKVRSVEGGCVDIGYSSIGGIGYRCGWGNLISHTCFRDGMDSTTYVICVGSPWDHTVIRVHAPSYLFYPGVTFLPPSDTPWALELVDGDRCISILAGSGDIPTPRGRRRADYLCKRDGLELADLRRQGTLWEVSAVRWTARSGYGKPRYVAVAGAFFGTLPPAMARQNALAGAAYRAAVRLVRQRRPHAHLDLVWVRLALPESDWAYVLFTPDDASRRGYFELVHRVGGRWLGASGYKPYCTKLPKRVRRQLFLPVGVSAFRLSGDFAPRGEVHC